MSAKTLSRAAIAATAKAIAPHVRLTPVIEVDVEGIARPVSLKLELMQHTASFKPRGAFANLLGRAIPSAGVAAASGGNHGAAVAYAARALGCRARIFIPAIAAPAKRARIASYGAEIVQEGANYAAALEACQAYARATGALDVHAYDDVRTLLGQGTLGLEIEAQGLNLDTLLVAVGGGGLIGGIAAWFAGAVKIVGVEPQTSNALAAALAAGAPVGVAASGIAADSLGASRVGDLMFPIAQAHVDHVALVGDRAIRDAQRWLWERLRLIAEPGGAAALAGLLSRAYAPTRGERVGVILCGANTELETFAQVIAGHD